MELQSIDVTAPWAAQTVVRARLAPAGLDVWFADGVGARVPMRELRELVGGDPVGVSLDEDTETVVLALGRGRRCPLPWDHFRYRADAAYKVSMNAQDSASLLAVGAKLRARRLHAGRTQAELAAAAGVSRVTLSRLESGQQEASVTTLRALAAALGLDVGELLTGAPG